MECLSNSVFGQLQLHETLFLQLFPNKLWLGLPLLLLPPHQLIYWTKHMSIIYVYFKLNFLKNIRVRTLHGFEIRVCCPRASLTSLLARYWPPKLIYLTCVLTNKRHKLVCMVYKWTQYIVFIFFQQLNHCLFNIDTLRHYLPKSKSVK